MSVMHARTFARRRDEQAATSGPLDLLRALGWAVRGETPWPGRRGETLDHVVTGPSGVYVVLVRDADSLVDDLVAAAHEIEDLLDGPSVGAVLCLRSTTGLDEERSGVRLCSPDTLLDTLLRSAASLDADAVRHIGVAVRDLEIPLPPLPTLVEEAPRERVDEVPAPRLEPDARLEKAPQPPPPPVLPLAVVTEEPTPVPVVIEPRHRRSVLDRIREVRLPSVRLPEMHVPAVRVPAVHLPQVRLPIGAMWGPAKVEPVVALVDEAVPQLSTEATRGRVRGLLQNVAVLLVLVTLALGGVAGWAQRTSVANWVHRLIAPLSASYGQTLRVAETAYHPDVTVTASAPTVIAGAGGQRNETWYAVDLSISDTGTRAGQLPSSAHVWLRDSWGEDRSPVQGTTVPLGATLAAGATASGRLVFALPSERTPGTLRIDLAEDGSQTATFSPR